jgi:hypothetical protein
VADPLLQTLTFILSTNSKHVLVLDTIVNNKEIYQHILVIITTQKINQTLAAFNASSPAGAAAGAGVTPPLVGLCD